MFGCRNVGIMDHNLRELEDICDHVGIMDHRSGLVMDPDRCGFNGARETGGRAAARFTLEPPP